MKIQDIITEFKGKTFSSNEQVVEWLEKALDQVRLATIKEMEKRLPKPFEELSFRGDDEVRTWGFNQCLSGIKSSLNKLK